MFSNIGIRFDTAQYNRWLSAVRRVQAVAIRERNLLPKKCSVEYYQLVYRNIVSQRYSGAYPFYHPRYAKWKERVASRMDFWRLFDLLLKNLTSFRVVGMEGEVAYMGGINDSITDRHGKKVAMYGSAIETGYFGPGTKKKPRPVFWPTALEYKYKPWKEKNSQSLKKIKEAWR